MRIALLILLLSISFNSFGQSENGEEVFTVVEKMPLPEGGNDGLYQYIAKNTIYPLQAKQDSIQGTVFIKFIVSKTGEVTDSKVIRGAHPVLDEEALRIVNSLPPFSPGIQKGKPVNVQFILPIVFKLNR